MAKTDPRLYWSDEPLWLRVLGWVALLNFFLFAAVDVCWGFGILDGIESGGKYYGKIHGGYVELTKAEFQFDVYQGYFFIVTTLASGVAKFWALVKKHEYA